MYGFDLILQSTTTLIKKVSYMHIHTQYFMAGKDYSIHFTLINGTKINNNDAASRTHINNNVYMVNNTSLQICNSLA